MYVGYLEITMGPMTSGKTLEAISKATTLNDLGQKVIYINYKGDIRKTNGGDGVNFSSHHSSCNSLPKKIKKYSVEKLGEITNLGDYKYIIIDEAHFYDDLDIVRDWVTNSKKNVYVYGLDGNYKREKIGKILDLIPFADSVKKINASCIYCLENPLSLSNIEINKAPFTFMKEGDKDGVGSTEKYIALCRFHYEIFDQKIIRNVNIS